MEASWILKEIGLIRAGRPNEAGASARNLFLFLPLGKSRIGVEGYFSVNRQDFGMKLDRKLTDGGPFVCNEPHMELVFEAIH